MKKRTHKPYSHKETSLSDKIGTFLCIGLGSLMTCGFIGGIITLALNH